MTHFVRIGDAAAILGTQTHVLRHWEDLGVLQPGRSSSGHRVYDDEQLTRARLVQVCQRAGMSLTEIRTLGGADATRRTRLIEAKHVEIRQAVERLQRAEAFLGHVLECRHPIVSECDDCVDFATGSHQTGSPAASAVAGELT